MANGISTYAAAGRLSEIFGGRALNYDRTERRRGMGYGADQSVAHMKKHDKEVLAFVQDYADGVTAYINQLHPKITPWNTSSWIMLPRNGRLKTALLLMYMTKMLAGER